ncbi:MAG TPA: response regulator transcription factor [Acidimicrobiales bacterium]|nr:response regulator transcription factor [Acidimicrobiales bacterium]
MRLLLAEDDDNLRGVLERGLKEEGYVVDAVANGRQALDYLGMYEYALAVLDWRMPGASGLDVIVAARRRGVQTPFLVLTARDAAPDRVQALDEGADDYLVKPFDYGELLARLRALLRRPSGDRAPLLRCGSLAIDPATHETLVAGEPTELTPREFAIMELLARKSPAVVHRRSIALHAWPEEADAVGSNTIDVHIARLRAKIARSDARIETVRGAGYRLVASSK